MSGIKLILEFKKQQNSQGSIQRKYVLVISQSSPNKKVVKSGNIQYNIVKQGIPIPNT